MADRCDPSETPAHLTTVQVKVCTGKNSRRHENFEPVMRRIWQWMRKCNCAGQVPGTDCSLGAALEAIPEPQIQQDRQGRLPAPKSRR